MLVYQGAVQGGPLLEQRCSCLQDVERKRLLDRGTAGARALGQAFGASSVIPAMVHETPPLSMALASPRLEAHMQTETLKRASFHVELALPTPRPTV